MAGLEIQAQRDTMRAYGTVTSDVLAAEETRLGLPRGFVGNLLSETAHDDWSFVIKVHALIEVALTRAITVHFGATPPEEEWFANLGVSGKMRLAQAAGLIDGKSVGYIQRLSGLRNDCVHRIEHVGINLKQRVDGLSDEDRKKLAAALALHIDKDGALRNLIDFPRFAFLGAALHVLERLTGGTAKPADPAP